MPTPDEHQALSRRRDELRQELAHVADLRQGSLSSRYRRCGKPRCHCAQEGDPGHGPYWSVTRAVHGKTQFRSPVHCAGRGAPDRGADRGVPSLSTPDSGVCRCQHPLVRCAVGSGRAGRAGEKGGLETTLTAEVSAEAERLIGEGALDDFQAFETEARRVALQLMGQAVARKLNADHCDEQGSHLPCECGAEARLAGRRPKTFTTALGPLTLERAWYHCERCHHGFSPRDRALGMEHTFVSPAALRMMGIAAARTSFAGGTPYSVI